MTRTSTLRFLRSDDRSRQLFSELASAQQRALQMEIGVPTTADRRRTGMLSQISGR
jgi:hypothetical protein